MIYDKVKVIVKHFNSLPLGNNCSINHLKEECKIFCDCVKRMFQNCSQKNDGQVFFQSIRFWKLQLFTYSGIMSCCCDPMLSQRESFYFCHALFSKKRQSKKHETLEIFGQTMTRVKKDIEMLLTYFWINAQTIPSDRENSIFRVASTHHIEHPTKNTTTVLHQFCLIFCQTRRKKFH